MVADEVSQRDAGATVYETNYLRFELGSDLRL